MNVSNTLVVDSQPIVVNALTEMLNKLSISDNIISTASKSSAYKIISNHRIELILLDINLKDGSGIDLIRRVKKIGYKGLILFISSNNHPIMNQTAREIGANGYILKTEDHNLIQDAIYAVHNGYSVFKNDDMFEKLPKLSSRESVIFDYLSKGYSNKKISELLSLSSKTISTYKSRILEKYNASSIIEIKEIQNFN